MKISKPKIIEISVQVALLMMMLLPPVLINYFSSYNISTIGLTVKVTILMTLPMVIVYLLNFYLFVPYFYFRHRRWVFLLVNIILIPFVNMGLFYFNPTALPIYVRLGYYTYVTIYLMLNVMFVACALGLRYMMRWAEMQRQLEEQKQKNTEAELNWLKNQLNPHFLFNTLNNISSLTQIDADAAQESISQLSDLLRYALYQSNQSQVPIAGEIEFMRNYIDLMKLRCGPKTNVAVDMDVPRGDIEIAPLLFISLIENAFKHGVSSSRDSFIDISLHAEGGALIFRCDNSNYPKTDKNRSGSGIGLENMRRRLQLIYPGRYTMDTHLDGEVFKAEIKIVTSPDPSKRGECLAEGT
jgi:hypothetical protein